MLTLAIETSNPAAGPAGGGAGWCGHGVALGRVGADGGCTLLGVEMVALPNRQDDDLLPAIDRLAARCGVGPGDLERVAVSVGPGGFTAVRVAVATATMLALAARARGRACACVAVPSPLVAAWAQGEGPVAVALASKGETVHLTTLAAGWRERPEDAPAGTIAGPSAAADLAARGVRVLLADGHLPEAWRSAAEGAGMRVDVPRFEPAACLAVSARLGACEPGALVPVYPREPEAVTLWRERGKGKA